MYKKMGKPKILLQFVEMLELNEQRKNQAKKHQFKGLSLNEEVFPLARSVSSSPNVNENIMSIDDHDDPPLSEGVFPLVRSVRSSPSINENIDENSRSIEEGVLTAATEVDGGGTKASV